MDHVVSIDTGDTFTGVVVTPQDAVIASAKTSSTLLVVADAEARTR
jgi:N-methylhydantoinase A/oxoprolinase/acetone carboxylase beta subunit